LAIVFGQYFWIFLERKTATTWKVQHLIPEHEIAYNRAPRVKFAPETSDQYPRVVAALDPKRRVIECAAGLQWIIQVRKRNGAHPWESVSFCRTKEALLRLTGNPAVLQSLPDWFPEA
jgi:hypothetical protein